MDLKQVRTYLERDMQTMLSDNADLAEDKWTFQAVDFKASAGEHLIISVRDWNALWRAITTADAQSSSPTVSEP